MEALGAGIASALKADDLLLLRGPLGSGKTTFARGLLRRLCGDSELVVPSPSYTLVQTYETRMGPAHHVDLYRTEDPAELVELGLEELMGVELVLLEWPERLPWMPPVEHLDIGFRISLGGEREVTVAAVGNSLSRCLEAASKAVA